jgi:signal transduction histidine kinase
MTGRQSRTGGPEWDYTMSKTIQILCVDTSLEDRARIRKALESGMKGVSVVEAGSLGEFKSSLAQLEFNLVLADLSLARLHNWELLEGTRRKNIEIPVVILAPSASASVEDAVEAIQLGASDFILKTPETISILPQSILKVIKERRVNGDVRKLNLELERQVKERSAQLEAANKELEAFSYSVSHDLRAPLRAIEGFAGILGEDYASQLEPEAQRYLDVIVSSAGKMNRLIDDLLAFSRLSRVDMELRSLDMNVLAKSVVSDLRKKESERPMEIIVQPLPEAEGDAALIRKVWLNLVSNAFKFTRKKSEARIEIGGYAEPETNVYYVRDNGTGFDMQYAPKLFGIFQRLHRVEEFEGSGVGLAICQRILHRHGGRIWTEAKPEEGATFYFTLAPGK